MKASDLLVKSLENEGVEFIFGIPGEENLDFLESLRYSSIRLILTRHEQGAGFMAATYGRLTGKPGVCLSTLGPGATNFLTPAAYAQLGAMPMVMLTGQKPIKESKQGLFQIIDIVDSMKPITKYARQIVNGNMIPSMVREAFRVSKEERPGAVLLELPEDIAREETQSDIFTVRHARRANAGNKSINKAVELIQNAKMPLLLIGAGANRNRTSLALKSLIEKTGIPFFNTQMGKGVVDERNPLFLGTAALSQGDYIHCAIDRADLIVNIGHDVIEKPPFIMQKNGKKVIHINYSSAQMDEVYFPQLEVVGDIANSVYQLRTRIINQKSWDFSYYKRLKIESDNFINAANGNIDFPIKPQRFVISIRKSIPEDGILTLDNGMYKIWFARNYKAYQPNTILLDNALATMGAGLPSAIAAKIVNPDKKVISVVGDGGFLMNSQEIETAIRLNLNLVIIILNDSAYGMIKWKQAGMNFKDFGLDFNNPDFVKYAEAYGAKGYRPNSVDHFEETLTYCIKENGVHIIDLAIDYSENNKVLYDELKNKTCIL